MATQKIPKLPKPNSPPPDAAYVYGLYRVRLTMPDEAELRTHITDMRALVDLEYPLAVPQQYRAITQDTRTPFARDSWLRVTAALTQQAPVPHVDPRDDTDPVRRAANVAERFVSALWDTMPTNAGDKPILGAMKALIRDSESVLKVVHRPDAWANFPELVQDEDPTTYTGKADDFKKRHMPFGWTVVDRLQMLFGDGEFGDDWAVEYGEYPRPYLGSRFRMQEVLDPQTKERSLINPKNLLGGLPKPEGYQQSATGRSIKIEYWDADWWAVVIDGAMAPGFPRRNPYAPLLPYFRAKVNDPPLLALKTLEPSLSSLITMKMNWAYLGAYPNPVIETVPNNLTPALDMASGDEGPDSTINWVPGKSMELPVGKTIKFLVPPPVGQDIDQLIVILRGLIDVAGIPSVFRGQGGMDQAGYAINQLIAAASLTYKMLSAAAGEQLESATRFVWHVIQHRIRQTVYVRESTDGGKHQYLSLSPTGKTSPTNAPIDLLADISYAFRPMLPTDEQARAMIAMQLVNAPKQLISKAYAREKYLQLEDPQSMQDDIYVEDMLDTDPTVHQAVVAEAMRLAGFQQPTPPQLLGPNGQPMPPSGTPPGQPPGQSGAGFPSVQGLNQPIQPVKPQTPPIHAGGRAAGAFPGQPGGVR